MITITIQGRITDSETGAPLAGFTVKPFDERQALTGRLGQATTAHNGRFTLTSDPLHPRDLCDGKPVVFFEVYKKDAKKPFYTSEESWSFKTKENTIIEIGIPWEKYAPVRGSNIQLVDEDGKPRETYESGELVQITAEGLRPRHTYSVNVEADGKLLFASAIIANRYGAIEPYSLWPQAGLTDPNSERVFTVEEARRVWEGRAVSITLTDGRKKIAAGRFTFDHRQAKPLILHTDAEGRLLNGFVLEKNGVALSGWNMPFAGEAIIYMVAARQRWQTGDIFTPIILQSGKPAIRSVVVEKTKKRQTFELFKPKELRPGAYDFVIRPLRYGYDEDQMLRILPRDLLAGNRLTGLVVREEFMTGKFVRGGCVNKLDISGRSVSGTPYFQYADTFEAGEDVYMALDPNIVDPGNAGKMCAVYVIPNKTQPQWDADNSLNHLPVLGGNAAVQKFLVQTYCVNANKRLIWPAAADVGEYDIVLDFGNNSTDAATFVNDNLYNTPLDIIDGYVNPGFRIIEDPTTFTEFNFFGQFDYSEATKGSATVLDEFNFFAVPAEAITGNVTVPLRARVMFPADAAGATTAAQISLAQPSYPLIVIVHGAGHNFVNYDFLLQHFAQNGFIAASIHLSGMGGLGRANTLFQHIDILKAEFGAAVQNNIGIMGHSRGGEAVVKAARLNQQQALSHNINAIISLAPTDQYGGETLGGPWATPYLAIHGSMDGDVRIFQATPFGAGAVTPFDHRCGGPSLYDRANGAKKSMVFVYGATHNGFSTTNEGAGGANGPQMIQEATQRTIAQGYMNAFFRQKLKGENKWEGIFTGEWQPQATTQAEGGTVKLFVQYANTTLLNIDHFEGAHTATSWQTSSIGAAVTQTGLPANPVENELFSIDGRSAHDTGGLMCAWNSSGDKIEFAIPAASKNVSAFKMLSFRIGQKAVDAANPANLPTNLRVALKDGSGNERAIRVSAFAEIPFPHQRLADPGDTLSIMRTVRIPLTSYTIVCAGVVKVDLTDIVSCTFLFSEQATGAVAMDDICFTN
jgi:hypothetical protein